ncbi:ketopantoate reductase family protein, partial [Thermodesulfobacteriota bacterium]
MRMIIYGAGGVGCVIGGHLVQTGHDVVLIGRPGHVNRINEKGLRFVTPGGVHELKIPAVTHPDQIEFTQDDVIFLCMKGQDTEKALQELSVLSDKVPVFCVQNGVRNEEIASEYFQKVYGVMISVGAVYLNDGEVMSRREPPGWLIMGKYSNGDDD